MKLVYAYIKPHKLQAVVLALHRVRGLTGLSISNVEGFGRGWFRQDTPPASPAEVVDFIRHVRLEVFCRDELAEQVVQTIQQAAHTGLRGDGKIFVLPVEDAVRISTGERGQAAL